MKQKEMTVLVYGATGVQGGEVARRLLEAGHQVRALTRHPEKAKALAQAGADVVIANLQDQTALVAATQGVDAVFLQVPVAAAPSTLLENARRALLATKMAGSPHLVLTTSGVVPPQPTGLPVPDARYILVQMTHELIPNAIVLTGTLYLENYSQALRPAIEQGVIPDGIPSDVPVAWLSTDDHAAFVVAAIERPELAGRVFALGGPETLTGAQLAVCLSQTLGHKIQHTNISPEQFGQYVSTFAGEEAGSTVTAMYAYEGGPGSALLSPNLVPTLAALPVQLTSVATWATKAFATR